MLKFVKKV